MDVPELIEVNALAARTGMSSRFWKNLAKSGQVRGSRLGNRVLFEVDSVNRYLEATRIRKLEQPQHLRRGNRPVEVQDRKAA